MCAIFDGNSLLSSVLLSFASSVSVDGSKPNYRNVG